MEVLTEAEVVKQSEIQTLMNEANEILKVVSSARKTIANKKLNK